MALFAPLTFARAVAAQSAELADPVLASLVADSLAGRPELRAAAAEIRVRQARVPQAGALPDPVVLVGIQNDGFTSIEIGKMETSYLQFMVSQTFPWPGKRGLRTEVPRLDVRESQFFLQRTGLSIEAEVKRLYVSLLAVRDRIALLGVLQTLWQSSASVARTTYESGRGAQSDILRAQLELMRLRQRSLALDAEEASITQSLNRLRDVALSTPIATSRSLTEGELPLVFEEKPAVRYALTHTPELLAARNKSTSAARKIALANKGYYPDLTVNAGIMPRGTGLSPMWLLSLSAPIPVFSGSKQGRAVEESQARSEETLASVQSLEQLIRLRIRERHTILSVLLQTAHLYRDALLKQSRTTAESTLTQFQVGRASFAAVLEANAGVLADEDANLQILADVERVLIAQAELTLEPLNVGSGGGSMSSSRIPGVGVYSETLRTTAGNSSPEAMTPAGTSMSGGM